MAHVIERERKGDYGIDGSFHTISARQQAIGIGVQAAALAAWSALSVARGKRLTAALTGASSIGIATSTALYIYATKAGKFEVWNRILDDLHLTGDETVLDMGCGRGAVLLATARTTTAWTCGRRRSMAGRPNRQLANGDPGQCGTGRRRRPCRTAHRKHDRTTVRGQQL